MAKHKIMLGPALGAVRGSLKALEPFEVQDHEGNVHTLTPGEGFETDDSVLAAWVAERAAIRVGNDRVTVVTEYEEGESEYAYQQEQKRLAEERKKAAEQPAEPAASTKQSSSRKS